MRAPVTLCLLAMTACASATSDPPASSTASTNAGGAVAPVASFDPPVPRGCSGAGAYDACFALADATPLAVRAILPHAPQPNAVAFVRFERASGQRDPLDLDYMRFKVRGSSELDLYFQVRPGTYRISVGVDTDGDGDPEGPADDLGWSSASPDVPVLDSTSAALVDVATAPIATTFTLAARQ